MMLRAVETRIRDKVQQRLPAELECVLKLHAPSVFQLLVCNIIIIVSLIVCNESECMRRYIKAEIYICSALVFIF